MLRLYLSESGSYVLNFSVNKPQQSVVIVNSC